VRGHARTLRGVRHETERLLAALVAWLQESRATEGVEAGTREMPADAVRSAAGVEGADREPTDAAPLAAALAPPSWGEVTGVPPQAVIGGSGLLYGLLFVSVVAWAGLDLLAATGELLPVLILAAARFIFPLWPVLRYREPAPAEVAT